jgi:CTP-dependent riboflavin kinase
MMKARIDRPASDSPASEKSAAVEAPRVSGIIRSGLGEGSAFMSLDWVRQILRERLGFAPYPATLNLRLESEEEIARWAEIRAGSGGLSIPPPRPSFCESRCWHVVITGAKDHGDVNVHGAVLFPLVDDYPEDKVEIVAPVSLKDSLGARDGDRLTLAFL